MSVKKADLKKQLMQMMIPGTDTALLEEFIKQVEGAKKSKASAPKAIKKTAEEVRAEKMEAVKAELETIKETKKINKESRERRLQASLEEKEKTKTLRVTRKK